jgi:hypothetical protein
MRENDQTRLFMIHSRLPNCHPATATATEPLPQPFSHTPTHPHPSKTSDSPLVTTQNDPQAISNPATPLKQPPATATPFKQPYRHCHSHSATSTPPLIPESSDFRLVTTQNDPQRNSNPPPPLPPRHSHCHTLLAAISPLPQPFNHPHPHCARRLDRREPERDPPHARVRAHGRRGAREGRQQRQAALDGVRVHQVVAGWGVAVVGWGWCRWKEGVRAVRMVVVTTWQWQY